ncbi:MAG: secondary thiamine-phosphate synthase enzyme YjbQ [Desulfobacteraceae bacterium]|nr:secondary thiamine-phosphate synthase enzyme YjbQ [Desulfobacteraceae bacterium]
MHKGTLTISSSRQMELMDLTARIEAEVGKAGLAEGICVVYTPHTTSGLTINEGADPDVRKDLISVMQEIVPRDHPYRHAEGNSPAHAMASLFGSSVTIFVENGRLQLGTWQKVFFCEFDGPRSRRVHWRLLGG